MKNHNQQNDARRAVFANGKNYRWNEDPYLTEDDRSANNTVLLEMKAYEAEGSKKNQGFFTTFSPEDILSFLTTKMQNEG